jgi:BirA family biotin operon repressor/biotin-[acetyl-CoA-carboxylase] ligase
MSKLSSAAIRAGLQTHRFGQAIYYWPGIGSTNDELKRLAEEGAPEGTLAIADQQWAGRGRLNRRWLAPAGTSLLTSLLFRPTFVVPGQAQWLTMICSLAAADAVRQTTGLEPHLKWPNDLVVDRKKLAGVLTELGFEETVGAPDPVAASGRPAGGAASLGWAVVGMGLNVNVDFAAWPDLADTATSLMMVTGHAVARLPILQCYLANVEARYAALRAGHTPQSEWKARLVTLGQAVVVNAPDGVYRGVAEAVDEAGGLLLRLASGELLRVLAGDVSLREDGPRQP